MKYLGNKVGNGLALGKVYILNTKIPKLETRELITNEEIIKEKDDIKDI